MAGRARDLLPLLHWLIRRVARAGRGRPAKATTAKAAGTTAKAAGTTAEAAGTTAEATGTTAEAGGGRLRR